MKGLVNIVAVVLLILFVAYVNYLTYIGVPQYATGASEDRLAKIEARLEALEKKGK